MAEVLLREVRSEDLPVFYRNQREPEALRMAAWVPRDADAFTEHWTRLRANPTNFVRAIEADGQVAGNIGSFVRDGHTLVGYWIGKDHWGQGVASAALRQFLQLEPRRPLRAHVERNNLGSTRVLEKAGFVVCGEEKAFNEALGRVVEELILELCN